MLETTALGKIYTLYETAVFVRKKYIYNSGAAMAARLAWEAGLEGGAVGKRVSATAAVLRWRGESMDTFPPRISQGTDKLSQPLIAALFSTLKSEVKLLMQRVFGSNPASLLTDPGALQFYQ